ncbi:MAG: phage tail protein [Zoogloeaceae bacterium]|jgi:hypothetical protein|nr:phage tail protein [Zoogloeaceae bacterium]
MNKPASLRAALAAACPWLAQNPENLHVFVEDGTVRSTQSGGISCEYAYTLTVIITDYAANPDLLLIPIVAWLRWQQPDMLENFDKQRENFTFSVDYLDNDRSDIEIKLKEISERVVVRLTLANAEQENGAGGIPVPVPDGLTGPGVLATITHVDEPPVDPYARVGRWQFWIADVPESGREEDAPPCP